MLQSVITRALAIIRTAAPTAHGVMFMFTRHTRDRDSEGRKGEQKAAMVGASQLPPPAGTDGSIGIFKFHASPPGQRRAGPLTTPTSITGGEGKMLSVPTWKPALE